MTPTFIITVENQKGLCQRGTAWFIAPDRVITAYHVVGSHDRWLSQFGKTYWLVMEDRKIQLHPLLFDPVADIACLRTEEKPKNSAEWIIPLNSDRSSLKGKHWDATGFPQFRDKKNLTIPGDIADCHDLFNAEALQLTTNLIRSHPNPGSWENWKGMSGAPVMVQDRVAGVLTKEINHINLLWASGAIPLTILYQAVEMFPPLRRSCGAWMVELTASEPAILSKWEDEREIFRDQIQETIENSHPKALIKLLQDLMTHLPDYRDEADAWIHKIEPFIPGSEFPLPAGLPPTDYGQRPKKKAEKGACESPVRGEQIVFIAGDVLDKSQAMERQHFFQQAADWQQNAQLAVESVEKEGCRFQEFAHGLINSVSGKMSPPYQALLAFKPNTVVSLFPDPLLELALSDYRHRSTDDDLVMLDLGRGERELYLLGGSARLGVGLLLTDDHWRLLIERLEWLGRGFRDRLGFCDIILYKLDLSHYFMQVFIENSLRHRTPNEGRLYLIDVADPDGVLTRWNPVVLPSPLEQALATFTCPPLSAFDTPIPKEKPKEPYKYLDYYTVQDAALFKGREEDTQRLLAEIRGSKNRITVISGPSGTGKTSIVLAALIPHLEEKQRCLTAYTRAGDSPELSILKALHEKRPDVPGPLSEDPNDFPAAMREVLQKGSPDPAFSFWTRLKRRSSSWAGR